MLATTMALVVGKAVLVANVLPFLHRFDTAPLIRPILFKTIVYWAVVFLPPRTADRKLDWRWTRHATFLGTGSPPFRYEY
jgi:hypothetical protein